MKKLFVGFSLLAFIGFTTISCNNDDDSNVSYVEINTLPTSAKDFVNTNFAGVEILNIEKFAPAKSNGVMYEVNFKNGSEVEFDESGNWIKVEATGNGTIPTGFISTSILTYIASNYPNIGINQIEKIATGFEVELTNDVDLIFDANGNFVRVDK